ncbi:MAG: hypothetical protein LBU43_02515 [Candidatus Accumulibacter sp.]|nr:hypothetical protein [Accumulibacter sp.]
MKKQAINKSVPFHFFRRLVRNRNGTAEADGIPTYRAIQTAKKRWFLEHAAQGVVFGRVLRQQRNFAP